MAEPLELRERKEGRVLVIEALGSLDGHTFVQLEERLRQAFKGRCFDLVLDLSKLHYIASAGVGVLISFQQQAKQQGGGLQLVGPTAAVREVFSILGLDALFTIRADLATALARPKG